MHKPPMLIMRSNNNSQHIADLGARFAQEVPPINIRAIGGGEWRGTGTFAIAIDDDTDENLARVHAIAEDLGFEHPELDGVAFELNDDPGALGIASGLLAAANPLINVVALLVVGANDNRPIVVVGVEGGDTVASAARDVLVGAGYTVYDHEVPEQ